MPDDFEPDTDPLYAACVEDAKKIYEYTGAHDHARIVALVNWCMLILPKATPDDCKELYFRIMAAMKVADGRSPEVQHLRAFVHEFSQRKEAKPQEQLLLAIFASISSALCAEVLNMATTIMREYSRILGVNLIVETGIPERTVLAPAEAPAPDPKKTLH